ncbi:DSPc-domain-containing protein [Choiromyces venosus 120613-1]|uniref:protein-tyrosine-phosphatase n=1 Tax=Choiromyces venosus 120613-1 TaxID=1336337 RepID=A0A3N4JN46_9PEZI|nr:DSPc-domain-containing protein [Choiromyces venosus 120613-1]
MVEDLFLFTAPSSHCVSPRAQTKSGTTMATCKTDTPSLKRTFTLVSRSNPSSPADRQDSKNPFKTTTPIQQSNSSQRMSLSLKRPYPFCKSPAAPTSIVYDVPTPAVPSFVAIFDTNVDMSGCSPTKVTSQFSHNPIPASTVKPAMPGVPTGPISLQHPIHQQNSSVSTSASSSTNSSPTTTISTVESAITEDHTPESSPDSSVRIVPLSSFRNTAMSSEDYSIVPPNPLPGCGRSISPSKKPRNTKNLSLNVPPPPARSSSQSNTQMNQPSPRSMSAPTSPAFIKPPPPAQNPRRRPSNLGLTIKLPGSLPEKSAVRGPVAGGVSVLRHHQSSPSLLSPGPNGIPGGMRLPPTPGFRQPRLFQPPRQSFNSYNAHDSFSSSPSSASTTNSPPRSPEILHEMEEEDEEPGSGEAKSPAYPSGPVCIFDPNIYLYAEPDAELASQFDVIVNVAREVVNPFKADKNSAAAKPVLSANRKDAESDSLPPDTACTEASFTTAFEEALFSPVLASSRKPKLEALKPKYKEPEYVHMPWDHNTPILDDLPYLVNLISDRASVGKKVLVHCQCGVSRSATLLIAYAMFKSPEKSMQDAYNSVKGRSKWIGPNMSLIYQLTDWKKKITSDNSQPGMAGWRGGNAGSAGGRGHTKTDTRNGFGRVGPSEGPGMSESIPEPQTAPLPVCRNSPSSSPLDTCMGSSGDRQIPQMVRTRSENGGFISGVSPGPSSAPPGMITIPGTSDISFKRQSWPEKISTPLSERADSPLQSWGMGASEKSRVGFVPPPLPPSAAYLVQRQEIFGRDVGNGDDDDMPPPTPGFTSPRNSAYFPVPMRRSGNFSSIFTDPRSPTQRGETPIVRSIFDVL